MISAVTIRRVGQLNHENRLLRNRVEDLKAERDFYLRRLADYQHLRAETPTHDVSHYSVCRE